MNLSSNVVGVVLLLASVTTTAGFYQCVDPKTGEISFSDVACPSHQKQSVKEVKDNTLDSSGSREQAIRSDMRRMQERIDQLEKGQSAQRSYAATNDPSNAGPKFSKEECDAATKHYEIEAGSMSSTKASRKAAEATMRAKCNRPEPVNVEIKHAPHAPSNFPQHNLRTCVGAHDFNCEKKW